MTGQPPEPEQTNDPLWAGRTRDDSAPTGGHGDAGTPTPDVAEELRRFAQLHAEGILTDDEFAARKAQLLGIPATAGRSRNPRSRRTKIIAVVALALLVLGGGGTAVALKVKHDNDVAAQRKADAKRRADAAERARNALEEKARAAADAAAAKRDADRLEIAMRQVLVKDLRASVTKDFKGRVRDGYLDGPILGTTCDPISGGAEDLEQKTGKFECLVANERLGGDQVRGYSVNATVNYTKGSYTWQMTG